MPVKRKRRNSIQNTQHFSKIHCKIATYIKGKIQKLNEIFSLSAFGYLVHVIILLYIIYIIIKLITGCHKHWYAAYWSCIYSFWSLPFGGWNFSRRYTIVGYVRYVYVNEFRIKFCLFALYCKCSCAFLLRSNSK